LRFHIRPRSASDNIRPYGKNDTIVKEFLILLTDRVTCC
jgi:hypothetical protein